VAGDPGQHADLAGADVSVVHPALRKPCALAGIAMAGAVLATVPITILYFLGQRFVVRGWAAGSVKG
jgi:ABC-type glycerol-3-phosphate transport system permease component